MLLTLSGSEYWLQITLVHEYSNWSPTLHLNNLNWAIQRQISYIFQSYVKEGYVIEVGKLDMHNVFLVKSRLIQHNAFFRTDTVHGTKNNGIWKESCSDNELFWRKIPPKERTEHKWNALGFAVQSFDNSSSFTIQHIQNSRRSFINFP